MANLNLFDLLDIPFDPPETKAGRIKKKIDDKKKDLGTALGRATQQTDRDAILVQLTFIEDMESRILSPDGKKINNAVFGPLAQDKTKEVLKELAGAVELFSHTHDRNITEKTIQHYRDEYRLSDANVRKVFTDAGFTIVEVNPLAAIPKFPTNADIISSELETLRTTRDPNLDTSGIADLYDFAAYISKDIGNSQVYRSMSRDRLQELFDNASKVYSKRNDDLGRLCGTLAAKAKINVFNSDDNRAAYEKYLIYHSKELTELFAAMKKAPKTMLLNPDYADPCIKTICRYFPNFDEALAIYNKEAKFTGDYYLPMTWAYTLKCDFCGHVSRFNSESEAQNTNSCQNCKKPFFKKCQKCGKLVLVANDSCPHCNYVFASAALFEKFFNQANSAFEVNDFNAALDALFKAESVDPNEKKRVEQLRQKVKKEKERLQEPINSLKRFIAERRFQTATSELAKIIRQYPNLDVSEFQKEINGELSKADSLFASAKNMSASKKADTCLAILVRCIDHAPSLAFLNSTPPSPCNSIIVTPVPSTGLVTVSWDRSQEQEVTYRLVRKSGNSPVVSENDGEILLDNSLSTSYTDKSVRPGLAYTYAIFTSRRKIFSSPVSKSMTLYSDVKNCNVAQSGTSIRISWDAPENSHGVTISRTCDGKNIVLSNAAFGGHEDVGVNFGKTYIYRVCANYGSGVRSPGLEFVVTPTVSIDSFMIAAAQVRDNIYKVTWDIRQPGIKLRVVVNKNTVAETHSNENSVQIALPKGMYCTIDVLAFSGGKWLKSDNNIDVNTYTACRINRKASYIEETVLPGRNANSYRMTMKIKIEDTIPRSVIGFYYTVRTAKVNEKWATLDDIGKSHDVYRVSSESYQEHGYISHQENIEGLGESAFFVTVFTVHSSGFADKPEIISEPQRIKLERPLNANLFWSVTSSFFGGMKLNIEMTANRPIEYIPELLLCACDANQFIASPDDNRGQTVMSIPAVDMTNSKNLSAEYSQIYSVETSLAKSYLKSCKFFLFLVEKDPDISNNVVVRWKQGFNGKV